MKPMEALNVRKNYTFTSESVSEGTRISLRRRDFRRSTCRLSHESPEARVGSRDFATTNRVIIGGEVGLSNKSQIGRITLA